MSALGIIGFGIIAVAILFALWLVVNYQPTHGLWEKEYAVRNFEPLIDLIKQYLNHEAYGQNVTPKAVTPTPVPTPTPTQPSPNFQYLPQKAYVQPFAPESGIPQNAIPLTAVPQTVVPAQPVQQQTVGGLDLGSIMGYLAAIGSAGAYLKGHLVGKKANSNEGLLKETMGAETKTKDQVGELARLLFEWNKEKSDALNGTAPKVTLDNLKLDKEEFTDKAAKS